MRNIYTLLITLAFTVSAFAQTNPLSKERSNGSFTQIDQYLSVIKRLGIPTANTDNLEGQTSGPNSAKILYNTTLNKLRIYNPVTSTWRDAIEADLTNYYTKTQIDGLLNGKIDKTEKGSSNGVATLDVNSKVPLSQIPDALVGSVNYQGNWNPATNTPSLPSTPSSSTKGHYYIASVTGTFNGAEYNNGDWIISNGSVWGKVDNNNKVVSVNGKQGVVDIGVADIAGLQGFLDGKADVGHTHTFASLTNKPSTLSGYGILDAVPNTRSVLPGDGISGGGNLSSDVTVSVDNTVVRTSGNQTIAGRKDFSNGVFKSVSGNSATIGTSFGGNGFSYEHPSYPFSAIAGMEAINYNTQGTTWSGIPSRVSLGVDFFVTNAGSKVKSFEINNEGSANFLQTLSAPGGNSTNWNSGFNNSVTDLTFNNTTRNLTLNRPSGNLTVNIPATGGSGSSGVNSVGLAAPTGFTVSGSPVTSSGTLGLGFASGYSLPTNTKQGQWDSAFGWGNHATAGYAINSRLITTGSGLTGGGNLTADRTLAVDNTVVRTSGKQDIGGLKSLSDGVYKSVNGGSATVGDSYGINGFSYEHPSYPFSAIAGMEAINYNTTGTGWAGIPSRVSLGVDFFVTKEGNRVRVSRTDSNGLTTFDNVVTAPSFSGSLNANQITSGTVPFSRLPVGSTSTTVAQGNHTHSYSSLTGIPATFAPSAHTLGSHSDVTISTPATGHLIRWNGSAWVNWNPNYLTSFTESDPTISAWAKSSTKPSYTFSEIGSKPSTLSGYGITDAALSSRSIIAGNGLTGGGNLTADRTLTVGAGDGITVNSTNVAVNNTVVRTSGAQSIDGPKTFLQPVAVPNAVTNSQAVNLGQINAMFPGKPDYTLYYFAPKEQGRRTGLPYNENTGYYTVGSAFEAVSQSFIWAYTGSTGLTSVGDIVEVEGSFDIQNELTGVRMDLLGATFTLPGGATHGSSSVVKLTFYKSSASQVQVSGRLQYEHNKITGGPYTGTVSIFYGTYNHTLGNSIPIRLMANTTENTSVNKVRLSGVTVTKKQTVSIISD